MNDMGTLWPQLMLLAVLFGLVLLVLWVVLPFAVFGIKPLLRQMLAEQKAQTVLLERIAEQGRAAAAQPSAAHRPPG
jgi:uncharacterized membrane protein